MFTKKFYRNNIIKIFGVQISFLDYDQLLKKWFDDSTKTIASVNQHFLNLVYNNEEFKEHLNEFDLVFPDGIGVRLAAKFLSLNNINSERTTFPDLLLHVFQKSNFQDDSYYFFGGKAEIIEKAVENIRREFSNVNIIGFHEGHKFDNKKILEEINNLKPRFLVVGLGGIKQEKWIVQNSRKLNVGKICAVGGALRVFAGDRSRGPILLRNLGLEWLVRLLDEPTYVWKRYLIGIPLFIFRVLKEKYKK